MKMDRITFRYGFLIMSIVSLLIMLTFLSANLHAVFFGDQREYINIAKTIRDDGLFALKLDLRTYFYPLFIAITQILTFSSESEVATRVTMSFLQWGLLIGTAYIAAKRWVALSSKQYIGLLIFGAIALNPWLMQACTLLLTEIMFVSFSMLAIVLFFEEKHRVNQWLLYAPWLIAAAAVVRPAGIMLCGFLFLAIIIRVFLILKSKTQDESLSSKKIYQKLLLSILGVLIIFGPQLYMNESKFGQLKITPVFDLSDMQMKFGLTVFKFRAVVNPEETSLIPLFSKSPAAPTDAEMQKNYLQIIQESPKSFIVAVAAHTLSLLDWGDLSSYPKHPGKIPRIIFSLLLYMYWFLVGYGLLQALCNRRKVIEKRALGYMVFCAVYSIPMLLAAPETRFAYLIYILCSPLFALAVENIGIQKQKRTYKQYLIFIGLFVMFLALMVSYSIYCDYLTGQPALYFYMRWFI